MKRTLSLKREPLTALTTVELTGIAGGSIDPRTTQQTPPQHVVTYTCFESHIPCATSPYLTQGPSCDYC